MKKINVFLVLFMFLLINSVYGLSSIDLISYWDFDTDATDSVGTNDLTVKNALLEECKLNNCYEYQGIDEYLTGADNPSYDGVKTLSFWYNANVSQTGTADAKHMVGKFDLGNSNTNGVSHYSGSTGLFVYSTDNTMYYSSAISTNTWHLLIILFNDSQTVAYLDNTEIKRSDPQTTMFTNGNPMELGGNYSNKRFNGKIDEVGLWNRELTSGEMTILWNSGDGLNPVTSTEAVVLGGEINNSHRNTILDGQLSFLINNFDDWENANCRLQKFNGTTNTKIENVYSFNATTKTSVYVNDSSFTAEQEEPFIYNAICFKAGINATSNNLTIFVDNVNPLISFQSNRINEDNTSFVYNNYPVFNTTFYDTYLFATKINVTNSSGETIYSNYSTGLSGVTTYFNNSIIDLSTQKDQQINIFLAASDTHTKKEIPFYDVVLDKQNGKTKYLTENKNEITITLKNNLEDLDQLLTRKEKDRQIFGYKFVSKKQRKLVIEIDCDSVIYSVDDGQYKGHFICSNNGLNGNWIDFEGQGEVRKKKNNNKWEIEVITENDFVEFNSIGGLNTINKTITFQKKTVNHTFIYDKTIVFSSDSILNQTIKVQLLNVYGSVPNINLTYNGTTINYGSYTNTTPNNYNFSFFPNINYPNINLYNDSYNFFINYGFDNNYYLSNTKTQLLLIPHIEICQDSVLSNEILNYTYRNEINNEIIAATNSYNLLFTDNHINYSFVGSFLNNISSSFCTNIKPTNAYNWGLSGTLTLSKTDYITRILNFPFTPTTIVSNSPSTKQDLFLIPTNESSTITYTWQTTEFQLIDGTMIIYKCNSNGSKSLIESTPIVSGEAIANLQLLLTPYSYEIIIDGETFTSDSGWTACHTESSTTKNYYVDVSQTNILPVIGLYFVDCDLYKIDNDTVNMRWDSNKEDSEFIQGCLITQEQTINGLLITDKKCINSSAGNITRDVTGTTSYFVVGEITQNNVVGYCKNSLSFYNKTGAQDLMGGLVVFGIFLLIASLAAMYSANGETMVISSIFGLIVSFFIGILAFSWEIVFSIICFLLIIVIIGRYSRKK